MSACCLCGLRAFYNCLLLAHVACLAGALGPVTGPTPYREGYEPWYHASTAHSDCGDFLSILVNACCSLDCGLVRRARDGSKELLCPRFRQDPYISEGPRKYV